jgi:hypothetical protein
LWGASLSVLLLDAVDVARVPLGRVATREVDNPDSYVATVAAVAVDESAYRPSFFCLRLAFLALEKSCPPQAQLACVSRSCNGKVFSAGRLMLLCFC